MKKILAVILLVSALCLGLAACSDDARGNKLNDIDSKEGFYAYSAASVGSIISSLDLGGAPSAKSMSASLPEQSASDASNTGSLTDEQIETVNKYMALVENLLSEGNIQSTVSESDREGYQIKNVVYYEDMTGGIVDYTLYYNEELINSETEYDDGETETEETYRIAGIMIVGGTEYPVEGVKEISSEGNENESEAWFRADLGNGDFIKAEQEHENEGNETEQEFLYTVRRGGVTETTTVEYEQDRGETELKMTVRKNGKTDVLEFEDETGRNGRVIKVNAVMEGERVSFRIRITEENGNPVYRYEFADGHKDFGRFDDDDDDRFDD